MLYVNLGNDKKTIYSGEIVQKNSGEGLNLRRDVYMRVANAVRQLRERGHNFVLVLPPWTNLWHWRNRSAKIPWSDLFDLDSLCNFVPIIEFSEFIKRNDGNFPIVVDLTLYLQHYAEGWSDATGFVMKYDIRPCIEGKKFYRKLDDSKWEGPFFGHKMATKEFKCLSIQGQSSTLVNAILEHFPHGNTIMVDRAETILHDHFGDVFYWRARKSMRYSVKLRQIGNQFRREKFNSNAQQIQKEGQYETSNYFCAHWRRADFVWTHQEDIPSIEGAAKQLIKIANNLQLDILFLCTDANLKEIETLTKLLNAKGISVERFVGGKGEEDHSDAAISIVDQWICANAKWFIGTHQSTFTFRIHEDREILGFPPESTFNRFCPDAQMEECEQPAKWTIIDEE